MGVDPLVPIVNIVEQVGVQVVDEKDAVVPDGRPATEKEMDCALPDNKLAVVVFFPEDPAIAEIVPELAKAKSNDGVVRAFWP